MKKERKKFYRFVITFSLLMVIAGLSYFMIQRNNKEDTQLWSKGVGNFGDAKSLPGDYYNYTIVFNSNGGTGQMENQLMDNYNQYPLSKNEFTKNRERFVSWNTKVDGSGISYNDEQKIIEPLGNQGQTVTLYAQWAPDTYRIVFNTNQSDCSISDIYLTISNGQNLDENIPIPVSEGQCFNGWYSEPGFSNDKKVTRYRDLSFEKERDIFIYANWSPRGKFNTYTIQFDKNGGNGESMGYKVVTQNDRAFNLPSNTFTKDGYLFRGWNTKANGSGTKYTDEQFISDRLADYGDVITLYAQWVDKNNIPVEGVRITSPSETFVTMEKGTVKVLAAEVNPEDATNKTVHWSSSNTKVATIEQSSGRMGHYGKGIRNSCYYGNDGRWASYSQLLCYSS